MADSKPVDDIFSAAPAAGGKPVDDVFAGDPQTEAPYKYAPEDPAGQSGDTWKAVKAGVQSGVVGPMLAGGRYLAERNNADNLTTIFKNLGISSDEVAQEDIASMSPVAQRAMQSAITGPDFWEHPLMAAKLKAANMTPGLAAMLVPSTLMGGPVGATAMVAVMNGTLSAGQAAQEIYKKIDDTPDKDLQAQVPYYAGLREMGLSEEDARSKYNQKTQGDVPLINLLVGAGAGLVGPAAGVARVMKGGAGVIGAAERGIIGRAGVGALEGGGVNVVQGGTQNTTVQDALVDSGLQKKFDYPTFGNALVEQLAVGVVLGGGAGVISKGHPAGPKPVEPPKVDLPVPASTKKVEVVGPATPSAEETVALTASAKPAPVKAGVPDVQPHEIMPAQPEAPPAQEVPPEVAAASERTAAPVEPPPEIPQEVTAPQPAVPEDVAGASARVAPAEEAARAPQILKSQDDAALKTEQQAKAAQDEAKPQLTEATASTGKNWTKAEIAKRDADATLAKTLFDKEAPQDATMPRTAEERADLHDRVTRIADAAEAGGIKLKGIQAYDTTADHMVWLREVADLKRTLDKKGTPPKARDQHILSFLGREAAAKDGDFSVMRSERAAEGALAKRVGQGDVEKMAAAPTVEAPEKDAVEQLAAAPTEVPEAAAAGTSVAKSSKGSVRGVDAPTEEGKFGERALAASPGRKVEMAPELKAKYEKLATERAAGALKEPLAGRGDTPKQAPKVPAKITPKIQEIQERVASAAAKTEKSPTPAQVEAGNYAKGHVDVHGLDVTIETPRGAERKGTGPDGEPWSVKMPDHYGYVKRTVGADGEHVDVTIGRHPKSDHVLVIDQQHIDGDKAGTFDEHKAMLGYRDGTTALDAYEKSFSDGKGFARVGKITPMSMEDFKTWLKHSDTTKAAADVGVPEPAAHAPEPIDGNAKPFTYARAGLFPTSIKPLHTDTGQNILKALKFDHLTGPAEKLVPFLTGRMAEVVKDTPVHILSDVEMGNLQGRATRPGMDPGQTADGLFVPRQGDGSSDFIALNADKLKTQEDFVHTMVHETVHKAMLREITDNPLARHDILSLMQEVKATIQGPYAGFISKGIPRFARYAFTNEHEFLAEAFSNPEFQQVLSETPISAQLAHSLGLGDKVRPTLWNLFMASVRKVLRGFNIPEGSYSALEGALRIGKNVMDSDAARRSQLDPINPSVVTPRRYEPAALIKEAIEGAKDKIAEVAEHPVKTITSAVKDLATRPDATSFLKKMAINLETFDQFARRGEHLAPQGPVISDLVQKQGVIAQNLKKNGDRITAELMGLQKKLPGAFEEFAERLNKQTMYGVDASAKIGEGRNEYLGLSKANLDKQAKGTLQPHDLPMSQWEAHGAHPELYKANADFMAKHPEFRDVQEKLFKYFDGVQEAMTSDHIDQFLRAADVGEADRPARVKELMNAKPSEEWTDNLKAEFGDVIAKQIIDAKKLSGYQGIYAPLMRHGDHVVSGRYKIEEPTARNGLVRKVDDSTYEFKSRQEAHDYAESTGLHYGVDTTYYDPTTGERTTKTGGLSQEGGEIHTAEQRYEVTLQRKHTEFHESIKDAQEAQAQLHATGLLEEKPYVEEKRDYQNRDREIGASALATVMKKLEQTSEYKRATDIQKAEMRKAMHEAAAVTQAGNRVQSRRLPRRNVEGASEDLTHNMLVYNQGQANYRAKIQFRPQIEEQIAAMREHVERSRYSKEGSLDSDTMRRSEYANEIESRARALDPNEYSGAYTSFMRKVNLWSYVDRMARPSHLILHQTHLPMITAPYVAGRHGLRAYTEMLKAWKQATGAYKEGGKDFVASIANSLHEGTDYDTLMKKMFGGQVDGARIGRMIDSLSETGVIHPQAGLEIAKYGVHNQPKTLGLKQLDGALSKLDTVFRHITNATEAINRYVGAVMAYRLEFEKGVKSGLSQEKAHDAATKYASETVKDTQGLYSSTNAAPLFQNKWLRPFLQFKQFPQMMYNLLITTATKAFKGATTAERVQGAASLIAVLGSHTMMTGLLGGVPLEAGKIAGMVTKGLGITDGDWSDVERAQYDAAVRAFGKDGAEYVMHGLSRSLGIDAHHRLGLNSFFTFGMPDKLNKGNVWAFIAKQAAGAPGGLAEDALAGMTQMMGGDVAGGAARAFPLQTFRDVQKAWGGGSPSATGFKYTSPGQYIARGLGFTPSKEAEFYEQRSEVLSQKQAYGDKRSTLTKNWVQAKPEDKASAWAAVQKFNTDQVPASRITMKNLQDSRNAALKKTKGNNVLGVAIDKKTQFLKDRADATY